MKYFISLTLILSIVSCTSISSRTDDLRAMKNSKNLANGIIQPLILNSPTTVFPENAYSQGLEGYVAIKHDILKNGEVSNIEIIKAEPEGLFDESAIRAMKETKWKAGRGKNGLVITRNLFTLLTYCIVEKNKPKIAHIACQESEEQREFINSFEKYQITYE